MQLRKVLGALEVRQAELAQMTGLRESHISAYCSGSRRPSLVNLVKMADALGCTTDAIIGRDNEPMAVLSRIPHRALLGEVERRMGV